MGKTVYVHVNRAERFVDTYISNTNFRVSCDGRIGKVETGKNSVRVLIECDSSEFITVSIHEEGEE